ncbi:MAG: hypothetical protein ACM3SW_04200, partial [Actinomycetota bacterium]
MIPLFAILKLRGRNRHNIRLWLPLFLIWLLLLPLVLVLLPFAILACLLARMNPLRSIAAGWQVLAGLRGAHIEVEHPGRYVLLR